MAQHKQGPSNTYRDVFEPGWRKAGAERDQKLAEAFAALPPARRSSEELSGEVRYHHHHPILAAIDRLRLAESLPPEAPALVGACGNCQRNVYMGGAFLHGRDVYCATEGCVLAALARGAAT